MRMVVVAIAVALSAGNANGQSEHLRTFSLVPIATWLDLTSAQRAALLSMSTDSNLPEHNAPVQACMGALAENPKFSKLSIRTALDVCKIFAQREGLS